MGVGCVLELSHIHLPDSFRRDTKCGEEVLLEFLGVRLRSEGPLHTEEPGVAFFVAYWESLVGTRNADWPIVLLKNPGTSQPAAQEIGQFSARFGEIGWVHFSDRFSFRQRIHIGIKFIHQLGDAPKLACCLVRSGLIATVLFFQGHWFSRV